MPTITPLSKTPLTLSLSQPLSSLTVTSSSLSSWSRTPIKPSRTKLPFPYSDKKASAPTKCLKNNELTPSLSLPTQPTSPPQPSTLRRQTCLGRELSFSPSYKCSSDIRTKCFQPRISLGLVTCLVGQKLVRFQLIKPVLLGKSVTLS